jgi:hypothetical protein
MNLCVCRLVAIVFGWITLGPFSAAAQTVMDATTAEFTASGDHDRVATDGTALLASYRLDIYPAGSSTPSHSVNLGKPTPGTNSLISVRFDTRHERSSAASRSPLLRRRPRALTP